MPTPPDKSNPPGDVRRVDVAPRGEPVASALRCPFCHDPVHLEVPTPWVACAACLARHHGSCWDESGRCGACAHERRLRPDPGRRPLGLLLAAGLGALLTFLGVAAFAGFAGRRLRPVAPDVEVREPVPGPAVTFYTTSGYELSPDGASVRAPGVGWTPYDPRIHGDPQVDPLPRSVVVGHAQVGQR